MNRSQLVLVMPLIILLYLWSCNKGFNGEFTANLPPETYTVVDTIIRFGDDRLESEVEIIWWGNDPDGFVVGYEFTFDDPLKPNTEWTFTERQDSIFILAPPAGSDTLDFTFSVRAIDNLASKDLSPASLTYPIKNSPPTVAFVPGINNPVKSFPVVKYFWEGDDPDGEINIASYELVWNDTTASSVLLPATSSNVLLEATDATDATMSSKVFINSSVVPEPFELEGMLGNEWNQLFIRAIDQSNAKSAWSSTDSIFIKNVSSNILLVDAYTTASSPIDFYAEQLSGIGFSQVDTIEIFDDIDGALTQQSADNLTQEKVFALFDLIVWFSNSAESSLSLAQRTTESFFSNDGKLLMSVYISSSFDPLSNFLDFTPIASLVSPIDTSLILDLGASLLSSDSDYPDLQGTSIVGVVKPVNLQIGALPLYDAELTAKDNIAVTFSPWEGNSTVISKKLNDGEPVFIFSTLELHKLNGLSNMDAFFEEAIINEFGF